MHAGEPCVGICEGSSGIFTSLESCDWSAVPSCHIWVPILEVLRVRKKLTSSMVLCSWMTSAMWRIKRTR